MIDNRHTSSLDLPARILPDYGGVRHLFLLSSAEILANFRFFALSSAGSRPVFLEAPFAGGSFRLSPRSAAAPRRNATKAELYCTMFCYDLYGSHKSHRNLMVIINSIFDSRILGCHQGWFSWLPITKTFTTNSPY